MEILFFLTDRFPYGKGEAFIENEIDFLDKRFDRIYVIPTGLTVNISITRKLPPKFQVLKPANTHDLYASGRPGPFKRVMWSLRYMSIWSLKSVLSLRFWREIKKLKQIGRLSKKTITAVVRELAPLLRNEVHFNNQFKKLDFTPSADDNYYMYSYWFTAYVTSLEKYTGLTHSLIKQRIARAHGHDLYENRRPSCYIPFREETFESLDHLVLISSDGYDYITKKFPQYKSKCEIAYLGTKDYGLGHYSKEAPFHIVTCSYVIPLKRVNRIADVLCELPDNMKVVWTHFGAGQDYESLKHYVLKKLSNKINVEYKLAGQFFNQDLMSYYKTHTVNLFINVSTSEGLPVSIMEAISFGIPVIATDVGGTKDAFPRSDSHYLLPVDYKDYELLNLIRELYYMPTPDYINIRLQARSIWEERFNAPLNYEKFISTYFD